ncbi:hypothetical protein GEMRC1_013108 [Eukaryota sp. GEM-RC1]
MHTSSVEEVWSSHSLQLVRELPLVSVYVISLQDASTRVSQCITSLRNSISRDYPFISLAACGTDGINTLLLSTTSVVLVINISGCKIPESLRSILLQPNITKVFNGEINHFEKLQQQFSISLTDSFDIAPYFRFTRKVLSRKTSIGNDSSINTLSGVIPVFKVHDFTPINPTNDLENQLFETTISVFCIALTHPYCCDLHDTDAILLAESKALTPFDLLSEYIPLFARLLFVILSDASNAEILSVISFSAPQIIITSCLSYLINAVQSLGERAQVDVLKNMIALGNVETYPLYFFTLAANLLSGHVNFDSEKVDAIKKLSFNSSFILAAKTDDFSKIKIFKNMSEFIKEQFSTKGFINSAKPSFKSKTNKQVTHIDDELVASSSRTSSSLVVRFLKWVVMLLCWCSWSTLKGVFKLFKIILFFLGRFLRFTLKVFFKLSKSVLFFFRKVFAVDIESIF